MDNTSLTKPQLAAYWRAATSAARNVGEPVDEYRKRVMSEECGVASVKALNRTGDFDKVMLRFSVDDGDYGAAGKFATAGAERLSRLVCIYALCRMLKDVGNTAVIRKALDAVIAVGYPHNFQREAPHIRGYCYDITKAIEKCFASLSAPARNCEVGTPDERLHRYHNLCREISDRYERIGERAPLFAFPTAFEWEDRPYEESEVK